MDEGNSLSTTALVVALIALIIALCQLLQQLLGTADGLRRCQQSVIGEWGQLTNLKFHLRELRNEVRYYTPQITLIQMSQVQDMAEIYGAAQPLIRNKARMESIEADEARKLARNGESSHETEEHFRRRKSLDADKVSIWEQFWERKRQRKIPAVVELAGHPATSRGRNSDTTVTWLQLVHELHGLFAYQWPEECDYSTCVAARDESSHPDGNGAYRTIDARSFASQRQAAVDKMPPSVGPERDENRTHVMLFPRMRTWDFMPPDVVRPLATIDLGSLIVLAMRLGMRWRDLKAGYDKLRANGNGYSFDSFDAQGIGLVMQFRLTGTDGQRRRLITSTAADKMMCGILPGCPDLVGRDFPMIGDQGVLRLAGDLDVFTLDKEVLRLTVFDPEKAPEFRRKRMGHRERVHSRPSMNDPLVLMMPFLPLEETDETNVLFSAWAGQEQTLMFHYWEARRAFLVNLREHVGKMPSAAETLNGMRKVLKDFERLEEGYYSDFYFRPASESLIVWGQGRDHLRQAPDLASKRRTMLNELREMHNRTRVYFVRLQDQAVAEKPDFGQDKLTGSTATSGHSQEDKHLQKSQSYPSLDFLQLVNAHINMAQPAGEETRQRNINKEKHHLRSQWKPHPKGPRIVDGLPELYEQACVYVQFLPQLVAELQQQRGCQLSEEKIVEAWWVLMLRGVVWDMSVYTESPPELVPSSFYGNQRVIWIA